MLKLKETIEKIKPLDKSAMEKCQQRLDNLTKPPGSLGMLEEIAKKLAGISKNPMPVLGKKVNVIMAADHGVAEEKVSAFPQEVTVQMVRNFLEGRAGINVLARLNGGEIVCVDMGVAGDIHHPDLVVRKIRYGTANMTKGPAMRREEAVAAIEVGIEIAEEMVSKGATVLSTGEMGIGNTTPSSAILAVYSGRAPEEIVGRGTGVDNERLQLKINVVKKAIAVNKPDPGDPVDVLSKVGGLEIGGLAGLILGAAASRIPVVIDGFISTAAAIIAYRLCPLCREYMIASHVSEEPGHRIMLELLGLSPLLHLKMRLGEGTGAVMAYNVLEAAVRILHEMATFESAGVSKREG